MVNRDTPAIIRLFNANREQAVLPLKYEAMAIDAFRFFRGTCHLFYHDLLQAYPFSTSPGTWICGDLHLENFGSYKGGNKLVYFDMNDFDEGMQAPLLYDLSRCLVSLELATAEIGLTYKEKKKLVQQLLQQYRFALIRNKAFNIEKETAAGLIKKLINKVSERKRGDLLRERTNNKASGAKLLLDKKLLAIDAPLKKDLIKTFAATAATGYHAGYKMVDAGFRIAGTGSIGLKRYLCLLENKEDPRKKRLIDLKLATASCIPLPAGVVQPSWQQEADRIIGVQDMMQHVTPAYLTPFVFRDEWYVARAIQPTADKIDLDSAWQQTNRVVQYLSDLAMLIASAHLRSSGRQGAATADALKAFAVDAAWENTVLDWASAYAKQVAKDYTIFCEALKDGYFN
ncbi:DUF2252 domain-containing protein [Paraflavitalea pollutisoli]|uniref:DUF2252 domain-containing protein n=1 Tax=Paraflavitalea pollutisoli TaxID=3034143 RepID=UPI0023EC9BAC|nr:DUF2252 family protein [Paraflavitalea sp. H1-2-19X]